MASLARSAILARIKTLVSDGGNNLFSDAAYNRFIVDAYRTVYVASAVEEDEVLIDSVTAIAHSMGGTVMEVLHVDYDNVPLQPITVDELVALDEKWNTRTATKPTHFYQNHDRKQGNPEAGDTATYDIGIWPAPTTVTTTAIRIIAKLKPVDFTQDADTPRLPSWCHEAVALEAAALVLEARGEARNKELAATYRNIRDFYVGEVLNRKDTRFSKCQIYIGQDAIDTRPKTLLRDRSVNATGRAGAGD